MRTLQASAEKPKMDAQSEKDSKILGNASSKVGEGQNSIYVNSMNDGDEEQARSVKIDTSTV